MERYEKAPQQYWESLWRGAPLPRPVRPQQGGVNHFVDRAFDRAFAALFAGRRGASFRILEAGCAQSAWLPYFAQQFGFSVTGIDYSPTGCERARQVLAAEGMAGEVVLGNFLAPPQELVGAFDAVVSFGVIEHFEDTAGTLRALVRFLRPGGVLVATVPNMAGFVGRIQRMLDRRTYELHRVLDTGTLRAAATAVGLADVRCRPFLLFNLGAVSIARLRPLPLLHGACRLLFAGSSRAVWAVQRLTGEDATHPWLAPYLWCSGVLPAAQESILGPPDRDRGGAAPAEGAPSPRRHA